MIHNSFFEKKTLLAQLGLCISRPPALCLAPGPQPWSLICIYRPWPLICIYRPWPSICIYRPWPPICIYRPWLPICIYRPCPLFVFTGPGLQFLSSVWSLSLHIPILTPPNLYLLALAYGLYYRFGT